MAHHYRKPTVAVIGASVAGCAAAADTAFSGFDVTLIDAGTDVGGYYTRADASPPPKRFRFRAPYLHTRRRPTSAAAVAPYLRGALHESGALTRLGTTVTGGHFDAGSGRWNLDIEGPGGKDTLSADIVVVATSSGVPLTYGAAGSGHGSGHGRSVDPDSYLHQGIEVVGAPNLLVVDGPYPDDRTRWPLDIIEARADHCRRYTRQLEIRGPGALHVRPDMWFASASTRSGMIKDLREFHAHAHTFTPAGDDLEGKTAS